MYFGQFSGVWLGIEKQLLMLKAEDSSWIKGQRKERHFVGDELKEEQSVGLRRQDFLLHLCIQELTQRKAASLSASCPLCLAVLNAGSTVLQTSYRVC